MYMSVSTKLKDTLVSQKSRTVRRELWVLPLLSVKKSQAEILRKGSSPSHTPVLGKGGEMLFNLVLQFCKRSLNKA